MKTIKPETQCKAEYVPNYEKALALMEMALKEMTGGNKSFEESALWIMDKTVAKIGVLRNLPYWLHRYQDGFAMETGSAEGFEDAEARIEAYQAGITEAYNLTRKDK